jgi:hypothetical protein
VAELVVLNGACAGTTFVLPDVPTVIGRSPESHLQIGDPWISSMHAMFERRGEDLWVVDLDSRNGTFVGGERVTESRIPSGALVRFGRTEIRITVGPAARTPPPDLPIARPQRTGLRDTDRPDITLPGRAPPLAAEPARDPHALHPRAATVLRMAIDVAALDALDGAPERLRSALDSAASAALAAGGLVTRLGGVGVLALYGAGSAAPDDASRALGAARAARRAVRAERGLDLRAAVEFGPVLAGNAGAPDGFELAVLGPIAERVERLLAIATRGEILAGPGAGSGAGLARVGYRSLGGERVEVFRDERP